MDEVKEEILNPLSDKFRIGKSLARKLISEMVQEIQKCKTRGVKCIFGTLRVEIVKRHARELPGSDFGKAVSFITNYFGSLKSAKAAKKEQTKRPRKRKPVTTPAIASKTATSTIQLELFA